MNDTGTITLAEPEQTLLAEIDFGSTQYECLQRSCAAAGQLTPMLLQRQAIPERRLQCFTSPEFGTRGKSYLQIFESNGTSGAEIFRHGNFLKHLRFFVHGATLPERVKNEMRAKVGDPEWFSGSDVDELRTLARRLVREYGLTGSRDQDFLHLCADLGLSASSADSVRRAVRGVR